MPLQHSCTLEQQAVRCCLLQHTCDSVSHWPVLVYFIDIHVNTITSPLCPSYVLHANSACETHCNTKRIQPAGYNSHYRKLVKTDLT
jgi:hypothetical protein